MARSWHGMCFSYQSLLVTKLYAKFGRSYIPRTASRGRMALPNRMNFQKKYKSGGVIFNPMIYAADFGTGLFEHKIDTKD